MHKTERKLVTRCRSNGPHGTCSLLCVDVLDTVTYFGHRSKTIVTLVDASWQVGLDTSPTWVTSITSRLLVLVAEERMSDATCLLELSLSALLTRQSCATAFSWPRLLFLSAHSRVPYQIVLQVVCCWRAQSIQALRVYRHLGVCVRGFSKAGNIRRFDCSRLDNRAIDLRFCALDD